MKVKNLTASTMMLGDDRVIGASGTTEAVRAYHRSELSEKDKSRVESGELLVIEAEQQDEAAKPTKEAKEKSK